MSLALGPLVFAAPLALIALLALPLLWLVLRATPPQPKTEELPSLALFGDLRHMEETPDKTPWWIILLRMLAITLAIFGLSQPIWSPPAPQTTESQRDILFLMDNDWASATNWSSRQSAALDLLASLDRDRGIYLITNTQSEDLTEALAERLTPTEARNRVRALRPVAWRPNLTGLAERLDASELNNVETLWIANAVNGEGFDTLVDQLSGLGPVSVVPLEARDVIAIKALTITSSAPVLTLSRAGTDGARDVTLTAFDQAGRSVSSVSGSFASGARELDLAFDLPQDLQTNIAYFRVLGQSSAGGVWYWEGASRTRRVGLLSEAAQVQPLLADTYYVRKALAPFATITEGTLDELLGEDLGAIILTDIGRLGEAEQAQLRDWVNAGGVLIRFAGPRMAAQTDELLPVALRPASRAFDSALSWDTPQALAAFPDFSPFASMAQAGNVEVRRQVLAQPSPELQSRTWASLEDGTPLITASREGNGRLILFHVTAGPGWSDLPLSGTFVEIMRRITLPTRELGELSLQSETSLAPRFWLDGFGSVRTPPSTARPIQPDEITGITANGEHPAGVYEGNTLSLPLNAGEGFDNGLVTEWPASVTISTVAERTGHRYAAPLLVAAMLLLLIDLIVSLILSGRLALPFTRKAAAFLPLLAAGLFIAALPMGEAHAQEAPPAALELKFGYIETGDRTLDEQARSGLQGLSTLLYRRTTVEPSSPDAIDLAEDPISLYPLIMLLMPEAGLTLDEDEKTALAAYLRNGGALVIDTRRGGDVSAQSARDTRLTTLLQGLDVPPLTRVDEDHVLTRSFYLLEGFTGRYPDRPIWIEAPSESAGNTYKGDGISGIFITDADLTAAWALNDRGRPVYSVEGGERNREMAYRTGVNIVMYILTGNYKDDQVHIPSLLDRLGEITDGMRQGEEESGPPDLRPDTDFELENIIRPNNNGETPQ